MTTTTPTYNCPYCSEPLRISERTLPPIPDSPQIVVVIAAACMNRACPCLVRGVNPANCYCDEATPPGATPTQAMIDDAWRTVRDNFVRHMSLPDTEPQSFKSLNDRRAAIATTYAP